MATNNIRIMQTSRIFPPGLLCLGPRRTRLNIRDFLLMHCTLVITEIVNSGERLADIADMLQGAGRSPYFFTALFDQALFSFRRLNLGHYDQP